MKKLKKLLSRSLLAAFALVFMLPMSAYANHQGSVSPYGHFLQPHGYVISGDFTFIAEVHGTIDRIQFMIVKDNKILDEEYVTEYVKGTDGDNYYNFVWNSSNYADGNYRLYADIVLDSANGGLGWRDSVVHYVGQNYLGFTVKNPVVTVPPVTQPPENTCNENVDRANELTNKIFNKHKKNFAYIDNFMQKVTVFASKHSDKKYDAQLTKISETRKASSDLLLELESLKTINCDGSVKEQVSSFVAKSAATRNSLDTYKNSVINFILKVIGDL